MDEAGVLAATVNKAESYDDGASEIIRSMRVGRMSETATSSAQFLGVMEHMAAVEVEADELQLVGANAMQLLRVVTPDDITDRLFSPTEIKQLVAGLMVLRGPMRSSGAQTLNYGEALYGLFKSPAMTYALVARDILQNSENSTYISLRRYAMKCAENAAIQGVTVESVDAIIALAETAYEPVEYVDAVDIDVPVEEREAIRNVASNRQNTGGAMAHIAMGPVFPPEPPKPAINNPYDFEIDPTPKPRATDDDNPLSWQNDALCAQTDPEAFFPEKGGSTRNAKRVCTTCDVRGECLAYALGNDERFGIWGGLSERERRKLKRRAS